MPYGVDIPSITLRVTDLERSRAFYVDQLGFAVMGETSDRIDLGVGAGSPLLTLRAGAKRPAEAAAAGLFHAALLFPDRRGLATWLAHAAARNVEFSGFADHGVSEAVYLSDPDGLGLEFYADRPRERWPLRDGELAMGTEPLAVRALLAAADPHRAALAGAVWGHLHLRVTELERSERFFVEALGMDVMQRSYRGARFLAANGYHHHLGLNNWGQPRQASARETAGLVEAVFALRAPRNPGRISDPDGNAFEVVAIDPAAQRA